MSKQSLAHTAFHALTGLSFSFLVLSAHAESKPRHWNYERGPEGPAAWGQLEPTFEACAKGSTQSPIDIRQTQKAALPALQIQYKPIDLNIVNNGHTVQVLGGSGQTLTVGDKTYELQQFHFHTPSEEAINGKRAAMVGHFVHKSADGGTGVISVLFQPGKTNAAYAPVFDHLPRKGERITVDGLSLDLGALLPADKGYYAFKGSLTTPPCSEGVSWMVLKQPVRLGAEQIKAFRRLYNANARPIQPLNGRVVQESM